jgi:UPF0755 protein
MPRVKRRPLPYWYALIIGVLVVIVVIWVWFALGSRPVSLGDEPLETFIVKKGEGVYSIGNSLKEQNLIRSYSVFKLIVLQNGIAQDIQAGSFRLSPSMTAQEIAVALTEGRQDIWITLLEGWRREEMAEALEEVFVEVGGVFDKDKFLTLTENQEGRLFPDTYLFPIDATEETVVSILTNTFDRKLTDEMRQAISNSGRSLNQIITMASLIEREARDETSRPLVSGILWKRLDNGWPLQVDATLQYAKGYNQVEKTWWRPPSAADKSIASAYNTYANVGLPPGPICAPSASSLRAAIYPVSSDYWFYLTDTKGSMHYAETIEEHNANVDLYIR